MKKFLVPAMLVLLLLTAGCDEPSNNNPPENPPTKPATEPATKPANKPETSKPVAPEGKPKPAANTPAKGEPTEHAMNVNVYFPDDSGMRLVEVEREILFGDENEKYAAAVETMTEEPDEDNLTRIFPKNAKIRSITVSDGLATVDFDESILKSFVGGSTGEEFLIGSIVNTLTNFPEITRVKFLVGGKEIETLSGHMDLSTPLERMNNLTE